MNQRLLWGLDVGDVFKIILGNGITRVGSGIASGPDRSISATTQAFNALEQQGCTIVNATRILCNICGSDDMTMDDYNRINRLIHDSIKKDAEIKFTLTRHDEMEKGIMVTIWAVDV